MKLMLKLHFGVILSVTLVSCCRSISAAPVSFQADSFFGLPGTQELTIVPLPDLTTGGRVLLGVDILPRALPSQLSYPRSVQPIDERFEFAIREQSSPGQSEALAGYTLFVVSGHVTGSIVGPSSLPPRNSGSFSGVADSVDIATVPGHIPQQLLELAAHPERIHVEGVDGWGPSTEQAEIDVWLKLDPSTLPAAIPEPSTAATVAVGITAVLWRRRSRVAGRRILASQHRPVRPDRALS
jgi:hypothetical protein